MTGYLNVIWIADTKTSAIWIASIIQRGAFDFQTLKYLVFKCFGYLVSCMVTIWILNTWNPKIWLFKHFFVWSSNGMVMWLGRPFEYRHFRPQRDFFVKFSDHHSETILFNNRPCFDHSNTRLVWYSDGYCIWIVIVPWRRTRRRNRVGKRKREWISIRQLERSTPIFLHFILVDGRTAFGGRTIFGGRTTFGGRWKVIVDVFDEFVVSLETGSVAHWTHLVAVCVWNEKLKLMFWDHT